jgi:rRNA-processing protein FCF1
LDAAERAHPTVTPSLPFGIGVLDANGIIGLAKSGCFSSLPHLFDALFVPTAVVREVTDPISRPELNAALAAWLSEANPGTAALQQIPMLRREADRSVLALALDLQPCIVVTSDRGMVNLAKRLLISTISAPRIVTGQADKEGTMG